MMWDRQHLVNNLWRHLRYAVSQPRAIAPLRNLKKWDWVSQQILLIGDYYRAWDWLIENYYDADTVITGRKGLGKTSVLLRIGQDKSAQKVVPFTVKDHLFIGRNTHLVPELIGDRFVPYSVLAIDELQHVFHKMRSTSTANVEGNKFMDAKRKMKLNVIGTMPNINSVDRDLVNDKIVFWINCWRNSKRQRKIYTVIHVNLTSKDGKFGDFVRFEDRVFSYCNTSLYMAATRKWEDKILGVENLEDYKKSLLREIEAKQRRELNRQVREIMSYDFLSEQEQCILLLDLDVQKIKIQKYLHKGKGFVYACEADMDLHPTLVEQILAKVHHQTEPREKHNG